MRKLWRIEECEAGVWFNQGDLRRNKDVKVRENLILGHRGCDVEDGRSRTVGPGHGRRQFTIVLDTARDPHDALVVRHWRFTFGIRSWKTVCIMTMEWCGRLWQWCWGRWSKLMTSTTVMIVAKTTTETRRRTRRRTMSTMMTRMTRLTMTMTMAEEDQWRRCRRQWWRWTNWTWRN